MKVFVDSNGLCNVDSDIYPGGFFRISNTSGVNVSIVPLYKQYGVPTVIYEGPISSLQKEDGTPYADYADLLAGIKNFFSNAALAAAEQLANKADLVDGKVPLTQLPASSSGLPDVIGNIGDILSITSQGSAFKTSQINFARLQGKSCYFLGTSLVDGNYFATDVCNLIGMTITKAGFGGYTIADGYGLGSLRAKIDDAIAANTNVLIFEGGLNDWYYSVPIGVEGDTVYTTYYGALNYIANKIVTSGKSMSIIPINLQQRNTTKSSGGSAGRVNFIEQEAYANAFIRVFEKYGIKTCDVFHELGITYENSALFTSDGVHPNAVGSLRWKNHLAQWILSNVTVPFTSVLYSPLPTGASFINWNIIGGFSLSNYTLIATSAAGAWNASAYSTETYTIKSFTGIQCEVLVEEQPLIDGLMFGLSVDDLIVVNNRYASLDYGFFSTTNAIKVYENGSEKYSQTTNTPVKLQIKINSNKIEYYVNDVLVYTSLAIPPIGTVYKLVATAYGATPIKATLSNVKVVVY